MESLYADDGGASMTLLSGNAQDQDSNSGVPKIRVAVRFGRNPYIAFGIFSLIVSFAHFYAGFADRYSDLSGDQINILTICAKKDHPELFKGDLVVGDLRNVEYYTPLFVECIRLASLPDHNYLRGLNILLLLTSLFYMWGWWLLFCRFGDRFVAAILAFLVRGIMWPPGYELWGIAGLWTMLPRTLFLALLPWVLWSWLLLRGKPKFRLIPFLLCGLLANIHPISGAGCAVALLLAEATWTWLDSRKMRVVVRHLVPVMAFAAIGMLPFIWTYLANLGDASRVSPQEFENAVKMRIELFFFEPLGYLREWISLKWLAFLFLPWMALLFLPGKSKAGKGALLLSMGAFWLGCAAFAFVPFLAESVLNSLGYHARFAFQLVRSAKYVMIPSIIVAVIVTLGIASEIGRGSKPGKLAVVLASCVLVAFTLVCQHPALDGIPYFGDDVTRMLWPDLGFGEAVGWPNDRTLDRVLDWIKSDTPADAKFVGPRVIRPACLRSVIHDWGGAGMLIEGNPKAFVEAARRERLFRELVKPNPNGAGRLFRPWGADYWLTRLRADSLNVAHADSPWYVYDLRPHP